MEKKCACGSTQILELKNGSGLCLECNSYVKAVVDKTSSKQVEDFEKWFGRNLSTMKNHDVTARLYIA